MIYTAADPEWGWWIILYFYLGGIAAGGYFMATLIDLLGNEEDRDLPRIGYWLALPLITLCGLFLVVDLHRPERFWHMLLASENAEQALHSGWPASAAGWREMGHGLVLKTWSPMSIGSWALTVFGLCCALSFLGSIQRDGFLPGLLRRGILGRALQIIGCLAGFFVAAYTGSLLTATNQPLWSDSAWIASLFLTSAASTGIAAMLFIARWRNMGPLQSLERLEHADLWALGLELAIFAAFLASIGADLTAVLATWNGRFLVFATPILGILLPLAIHLRVGWSRNWSLPAAAVCTLVGGFILRYAIVKTPPELLARASSISGVFSPEDGRVRGGGRGADPGNYGAGIVPRTKEGER